MGWFSKVFSSVGVNVITSVGKIIDDLSTSDEELALTDIQKKKITAAYNIKIQEIMLELDKQAAKREETMEAELTQRLQLDMKSDSWLSKNIRPMTLIFMTLVVSILAFFTIFMNEFKPEQVDTIKEWIPFFQTIMLTIYGFYFGSRGLEKIQKIRSSSTNVKAENSNPFLREQEPRG
ncbi:MAG: hypothetical protein ACI82Z_000679 [Cellvibrionaceae bacterium]|jgi:hypothetical protein